MKNTSYDKKYFLKRDLLSLHLADSIKLFMNQHNLKKVLDVGCGTGKYVHYLKHHGFDAYGCDKEKEALKFARKMNSPQIIKKAVAANLPYDNSSFDLVVSIHVIEHLSKNDINKFLSETHRILNTHGFVFFVAPNFNSPLRFIQKKKWFGYEDPTHIRFDTPNSIRNLLETQGFCQIQFQFKSADYDCGEIEAIPILTKLPSMIRKLINYLLFSTPLTFARNGFWVAAQKQQ